MIVLNDLVDTICDELFITREEFFSASKKKEYHTARQFLFYILYDEICLSSSFIQKYMVMNSRDIARSTIIDGVKSMSQKIDSNPLYASKLNQIKSSYEQRKINL